MENNQPYTLNREFSSWWLEERRIREEEAERARKQREQREAEREAQIQYWHRRDSILTDSIGVFLKDKDGFCFDPMGSILSSELYEIYCRWCRKQNVAPEGLRALSWRLKHQRQFYPVREATLSRNGTRLRGFRGIRAEDATLVTDKEEI